MNPPPIPTKRGETKKKSTPIVTPEEQARRKQQREKLHPKDPPEYVIGNGRTFQTGRLLGVGGFAKVFDATVLHDVQPDRCYALKVVRENFEQKKLKEKFESELQIHERMHHPYIVRFYEHFNFQDSHFVVLEHCANGSLMEMVRQRKALTEPEVRIFSIQMAGAIKYMHQRNVIHRDLKMGNILLDGSMSIKIADFGLAALLMEKEERKMTCCGTPNYIAPEILNKSKEGHDFSADLWSLGVIMFALLAGTPPFQSKTTEEMYARIRAKDYAWPEQPRHPIGENARTLVGSLLVEPDKRSSLDEVIRHNFFQSGWMPREASVDWRYTAPQWTALQSRDPLDSHMRPLSRQNYDFACERAGVGFNTDGKKRGFVGSRRRLHVLEEIVEDEGTANSVPATARPPRPLRMPDEIYQSQTTAKMPGYRGLGERNEDLKKEIGMAAVIEWTDAEVIQQEVKTRSNRRGAQTTRTQHHQLPIRLVASSQAMYNARDLEKENMAKRNGGFDYNANAFGSDKPSTQTYRTRPTSRPRSVVSNRLNPIMNEATADPAILRRNLLGSERPEIPVRSLARPKSAYLQRAEQAPPVASAYDDSSKPQIFARSRDTAAPILRQHIGRQIPERTTSSQPSRPRTGDRPRTAGSSQEPELNSSSSQPDTRIATFELPSRTRQPASRTTEQYPFILRRNLTTLLTGITAPKLEPIEWRQQDRPERANGIKLWVDYTQRSGLGYVLEDGTLGFLTNAGASAVFYSTSTTNAFNFSFEEHKDQIQYLNLSLGTTDGSNARSARTAQEAERRSLLHLLTKSRDRMIANKNLKLQPAPSEVSQGSEATGSPIQSKTSQLLRLRPSKPAFRSGASSTGSSSNTRHHVAAYQRLGDVRVFVFSSGRAQVNFPDHTKLLISDEGSKISMFGFPAPVASVLKNTEARTRAQIDELKRRFWIEVRLPLGGEAGKGELEGPTGPAAQMARANAINRRISWVMDLTKEWDLGVEVGSEEETMRWVGKRLIEESQRWVRIGKVS